MTSASVYSLPVHRQVSREGDQRLHVGITLLLEVGLECEVVSQRVLTALRDDHCLGIAFQLGFQDMAAEVLDDDLDLLGQRGRDAGWRSVPRAAAHAFQRISGRLR